jgi:hypothetical protein
MDISIISIAAPTRPELGWRQHSTPRSRRRRARGIARLYTEASEPARRFFAKRGFVEVSRNDFEIVGVPIHNFRMEKSL